MRQRQHHKNKLIRCQVVCQAAATKVAVKFDPVRAGHKDEAEIDTYTPVMTVSHRFEPIYIHIRLVLVLKKISGAGSIQAAAGAISLADRRGDLFIETSRVPELERQAGRAALIALTNFQVTQNLPEGLPEQSGSMSVWADWLLIPAIRSVTIHRLVHPQREFVLLC